MTSIKLTQEHKDKFLEMCNALFPDNKTWRFENQNNNVGDYGIVEYANENNMVRYIHWFEFCFYYIIPKLHLKPLWNDSIYEDCFLEATHLIDYLYIEFKKLK